MISRLNTILSTYPKEKVLTWLVENSHKFPLSQQSHNDYVERINQEGWKTVSMYKNSVFRVFVNRPESNSYDRNQQILEAFYQDTKVVSEDPAVPKETYWTSGVFWRLQKRIREELGLEVINFRRLYPTKEDNAGAWKWVGYFQEDPQCHIGSEQPAYKLIKREAPLETNWKPGNTGIGFEIW